MPPKFLVVMLGILTVASSWLIAVGVCTAVFFVFDLILSRSVEVNMWMVGSVVFAVWTMLRFHEFINIIKDE